MKHTKTVYCIILVVLFCLLSSLSSCGDGHSHEFEEATCFSPAVCECGETKGEALAHDFQDATCTSPRQCKLCGHEVGYALGHSYSGIPSCTEAQVCDRCREESGVVLGHAYTDATCTDAEICTRCGLVAGAALGHNFAAAGCTSPQICKRCNLTQGAPLGHDFAEADCVNAKTCRRCGVSEGTALGHTYADNVCIRCKAVDPDSLPKELNELHVIKSYGYAYLAAGVTDSYGYSYPSAYRYKSSSGGGYSIHNAEKKYTRFSGSIVVEKLGSSASVNIYVDDVLKYSISGMTQESEKIDFSIDVTGATKIKIETHDKNVDDSIAIVNTKLIR